MAKWQSNIVTGAKFLVANVLVAIATGVFSTILALIFMTALSLETAFVPALIFMYVAIFLLGSLFLGGWVVRTFFNWK